MFAKLSTVFALFAVAAQVAVAAPPACLIAAVNTQSDPSDIQSVCKGGASAVQKHMSSNCGDNLDTATSAFADVCKSAGVTISSPNPTQSSSGDSSSATGTNSASLPSGTLTNGAASGFQTQTANGSGDSASPTGAQPSQTGTDTNTGGASRLGMDILGLAAIGLAGFMLA